MSVHLARTGTLRCVRNSALMRAVRQSDRASIAAHANIFLVPSTAGQLHGVLGQAPPFFQVLVRVCPEPARPA